VLLYLLEEIDEHLALQWDGNTLQIPVDHAPTLLSDLRDLYYDALRGRRGHVSTVGGEPSIHMSVHNQGPGIFVVLEHAIEDHTTRLAFPVGAVPTFLNAAGAALTRLRSIMQES